MYHKESLNFHGSTLSLETGYFAKQADGSVLVQAGETLVLVTAVSSKYEREGVDFLPLVVDYVEKAYAGGKIPGGYFKREGKPADREVLVSRLIDRSIRPLFPEGYRNETQIIATLLSYDRKEDPGVLSIIGASTALAISDIPFTTPIAAVRVGRIDGEFVTNPSVDELELSDIDITVAGSKEGITMVEGEAKFISEEELIDTLMYGYDQILKIIEIQERMISVAAKPKRSFQKKTLPVLLETKIEEFFESSVKEALKIPGKVERNLKIEELMFDIINELHITDPDTKILAYETMDKIRKRLTREMIIKEGIRIGGRKPDEIRPISCKVGVLPRTHGSAVFTRGETQALVSVTLGTNQDEQRIDALSGETFKTFMLHYNFPPFSVNEVKPLRGPSRRDVGHGNLAERGIKPILPPEDEFPYTIRVVSEILESNGSSSMATVCGATLALMDAGIKIKEPVAGIAMGLIQDNNNFYILSDILGEEDHYGDMDFKVVGTRDGITSIQMDIKIKSIGKDILRKALAQAKEGRNYILDKMLEVIDKPRDSLSKYAPKIKVITVDESKIRNIIGVGGKVIKNIIDKSGAEVHIEQNGEITIAGPEESVKIAESMIEKIVENVEVGKIYTGKVTRLLKFGALVEVLPGTIGMVHISEVSARPVRNIEDILKEGDEVKVKVLSLEPNGKIRLSIKQAESPSRKPFSPGGFPQKKFSRDYNKDGDFRNKNKKSFKKRF